MLYNGCYMGKLEVILPDQLEKKLEERIEETGLSKAEVTRAALVKRLGI